METLSLVLNGFIVNEHEEILGAVTGIEIKHGRMFIHILEGVMDGPPPPDDGEEAEDPDEVQKFNTEAIVRGETVDAPLKMVVNNSAKKES